MGGYEIALITKYFGSVAQPLTTQAIRTLPHVSQIMRAAAYKRTPANKSLSDQDLIDELFKGQSKHNEK